MFMRLKKAEELGELFNTFSRLIPPSALEEWLMKALRKYGAHLFSQIKTLRTHAAPDVIEYEIPLPVYHATVDFAIDLRSAGEGGLSHQTYTMDVIGWETMGGNKWVQVSLHLPNGEKITFKDAPVLGQDGAEEMIKTVALQVIVQAKRFGNVAPARDKPIPQTESLLDAIPFVVCRLASDSLQEILSNLCGSVEAIDASPVFILKVPIAWGEYPPGLEVPQYYFYTLPSFSLIVKDASGGRKRADNVFFLAPVYLHVEDATSEGHIHLYWIEILLAIHGEAKAPLIPNTQRVLQIWERAVTETTARDYRYALWHSLRPKVVDKELDAVCRNPEDLKRALQPCFEEFVQTVNSNLTYLSMLYFMLNVALMRVHTQSGGEKAP